MSDHLPDLTTWSCFACGQQHPSGLRLRFTAPTPGEIRSEFTVSQDHTGLGNVVHGGIVATVFDEAMVWTLYRWRYAPHVTATMTQRFQGTVASNTPLIVTARITADRGRRRMVEAELYAAAAPDRVLANASGVYVPIAPDGLAQLPPHERAELDAVFSHFRGLDAASD